MKGRTPNELMPRAASRCHRDQLVAGLEALQTSVPDAGECAANTPFKPSQPAPAIEPPIGRRCPRAAEHPLGGSHQQPRIRFSAASAKVSPPSISLMMVVNSESMAATSYDQLTGRD